jgi:hypothetical protein
MVDAGGQPLGPPVIATIPRDPTPFAAIVSGRQMFHTSEMFGKNSVIPSLVEEAMKAVQAGFQEGECYEDIAMGALVALEHLGDPNIAAERTLEEKRRRFNMLVDWFEQYQPHLERLRDDRDSAAPERKHHGVSGRVSRDGW